MERTSVLLIRGVVGVIAGLIALVWPGLTLMVLVVLFGAYALADGIANIFMGVSQRHAGDHHWFTLVEGFIGVVAGILILARPSIALIVLIFWIGAWALITGVLEIVEAIRLRHVINREWLMALSGALSVLLGLFLFAYPGLGALGLAFALGAYALVSGAVMLGLAFTLRKRGVSA